MAEHLSPKKANHFIDEIVEFSDVVIFSGAIPGQQGCNHINEQWQDYWVNKFHNRGYVAIDIIKRKFRKNKSAMYYYPQNMLIFSKKGVLKQNKKLSAAYYNTNQETFSVVHPEQFCLKVNTLKK